MNAEYLPDIGHIIEGMFMSERCFGLYSTSIYFAEGLDFGVLRSDAPDVVRQVRALADSGVEIEDCNGAAIQARIPLQMLAQGMIFPENKGLRKMAQSGGNGSLHISH